MEGPDNLYKAHGYLEYEIYAGMQTSTVKAYGFKEVSFKDGSKIRWNTNDDYLSGTFIGTITHQLTGKVTFTDDTNDLTANYLYNAYTFSKQDYCWGEMF